MWHILMHVAILFIIPTRADYNSNRRDGLYSPTPIDDYHTGSFLSPRSPATIYPPGSKMTITWNTTSFSLKLILYQRNSTGADSSSDYIPDPQAQDEGRYVWTVDCTWDDYSSPYVMRGLDAGADEGYQTNDFWTPMFYIGDTGWGSSTRALPSSTSSKVLTRTESVGVWGFSTATATATPTAMIRTYATPTPKPTPANSPSQRIYDPDSARWVSDPGDWPESAALGLLMGITLAIVGIILCLITMSFNRLQRKEAEKLKLLPVNTSDDELVSGGGNTRVPAASPVETEVGAAEMEIGPVEMEGTGVWAEMEAGRVRVGEVDELVV